MKFLKITAAILGCIILAFGLFIFLFDWNLAKGFIERKASQSLEREIKIGGDLDVKFNWGLVPTVSVGNISVANMQTGTREQMLTADKVNLKFDLRSLFTERQDFPLLEVWNADVLLEKDKDKHANWNFGSEEKKSDSQAPKIGQLILKNSKLAYIDPTEGTNLTVTADSGADFRNNNADAAKDFIIVKGTGAYKNAPFKLDFAGASVLELQETREPYPLKTSIVIAKTTINVEGTVLDPANLQGMDITLNVKGANAADIFPIFGIALPPTPPYSITGKLDYKDKVWSFSNFKGKMGDSDLSGNLTFDKSKERPLLTAKFISHSLNFDDLGGFIGAAPPKDQPASKLTEEQKAKQAKQEASAYVIPDAPLDISRLAAMDADVEFTGTKVISPNLPLDDFYMHILLDNLILKVEPVKFGTANGDVVANLTVNARKEPVQIKSDVQFRKLALSRLFEKMPLGDKNLNQGLIGGRAELQGTGKSLRQMLSNSNGTIGVGMEGGQFSNLLIELIGLDVAESLGFMLSGDKPVPIRCVIGDFDVSNGVMKSKTLIIDTNDTNVKGEGTINLGNEEMDITLRARPKDNSILSLKSPIRVTGKLKDPDISIKAEELIARGGLGAAASIALTPFVAAVAFVEPGLGEDSNCAKLIREVKQDNGAGNLIPKNKNAPVENPKKDAKKQTAKPVKSTQKPIKETPALPGQQIPGQ